MRIVMPVIGLAIVFALPFIEVHSVYAESASERVIARTLATDKHVEVETATSKNVKLTINIGDTLTEIAATYGTTVDDIVAANAIADPNLVAIGQEIEVTDNRDATQSQTAPDYGQLRSAADAFINPPAPVVTTTATVPFSPAAASARTRVVSGSAGNSYAWGNCTWYVKERKPYIPNMLGNGGYGWVGNMAAAGYASGSAPRAGAIGVEAGHVVVVESVNSDGTVNISEMNYAGGLGMIHYRTAPASEFTYIYA